MTTNTAIEPKLFTVEETAAQLSTGVTKVRQLIATGELRSIKIGRLRRITASSIGEYIQIRELREMGVMK